MILKLKQALFFLCIFQAYSSMGQESMMPDVSYTYLEKLIAVAKANYPKMKMYDHSVVKAKAGIEKAQLGWLNFLNFNYLYSPANTTTLLVSSSLLSGYQVGLYFNVGAVFVNGPSVKMARVDYDIALDNLAEYNLNIEEEVKKRYFTYIKQLKVLSLRSKNVEDVESSIQQVKHKFERGEETLYNYNVGLSLYTNAAQTKIDAEGEVLIAKSALEELLGEKLEEVR